MLSFLREKYCQKGEFCKKICKVECYHVENLWRKSVAKICGENYWRKSVAKNVGEKCWRK